MQAQNTTIQEVTDFLIKSIVNGYNTTGSQLGSSSTTQIYFRNNIMYVNDEIYNKFDMYI
jgi:hypothetical protein